MTEGNPTEENTSYEQNWEQKPPYAHMDYTPEEGILLLRLIGLPPRGKRERELLENRFPEVLKKHKGDILTSMADLYSFDLNQMRILRDEDADPRCRKTGTYDLAVVRYWKAVNSIRLRQRLCEGETLGDIY